MNTREHNSSAETSEITLRLEQYDDIFSDFDIRPHLKRALSVDFLDEIKRAASDKNDDKVELILLTPVDKKNESLEAIIKERLVAHFKRHYHLLTNEKSRIRKLGAMMVFLGILCMVAATLILMKNTSHDFLFSFLVVFLEPAAWFLLWEGMDQILFDAKNINPELTFYRKMTNAHERISFQSY